DAAEIGNLALVAAIGEVVERLEQFAAHGAAQTARRHQDDVVRRLLHQRVIEPDLAELIDDDRGLVHRGVAQHAIQQRRLAAAEKARQHRDRQAIFQSVHGDILTLTWRSAAIIAGLPGPTLHIKNYHMIWEEADRLPRQ